MNDLPILFAVASLSVSVAAGADEKIVAEAVGRYADHVSGLYQESLATAKALQTAVGDLADDPKSAHLQVARAAWNKAREPYLQTEVFRFYGGPIDDEDGPEGLLNAWPMDENYIDLIIADVSTYSRFTTGLIADLNEKDGETNIASGFHALEYLLWGVDKYPEGPGRREAAAFTDGRFGGYAKACATLLVKNLKSLAEDWAPSGSRNYRADFLALPPEKALSHILTGCATLSGPELAGERLTVAYETREQEDEHSCFSDTTHRDVIFNAIGIKKVADILKPLIGVADPGLAVRLDTQVIESVALAKAIPVPFDQAILGGDEEPGRKAILAVIESLEIQSDIFREFAKKRQLTLPEAEKEENDR